MVILLAIAGCHSGRVSDSLLCPFQGVEFVLELESEEENRPATPEETEKVIEILKKRANNLEFQRAAIQAIGQGRITVQLSGARDLEKAQKLLISQGNLEFRQQRSGSEEELSALQVRKQNLLDLRERVFSRSLAEVDAEIKKVNEAIASLYDPTGLTGTYIKDAVPESSGGSNWQIAIQFDKTGAELFAEITKKMAGTGRKIGIFLNGELVSAPRVPAEFAKTGITGGAAVISGQFTFEEVDELAVQLRSGALPVSLEFLELRQVNRKDCSP
ncbi:MAG: hypothetical protein F6J93_06800 [Oscillatoria sp. SIO1A7]|nr:hypothetical protein [Oscillatoria sp. SIO1A7]